MRLVIASILAFLATSSHAVQDGFFREAPEVKAGPACAVHLRYSQEQPTAPEVRFIGVDCLASLSDAMGAAAGQVKLAAGDLPAPGAPMQCSVLVAWDQEIAGNPLVLSAGGCDSTRGLAIAAARQVAMCGIARSVPACRPL